MKRRRDQRQLDGVLILDKPKGPTSAACLDRIKRVLGQGKIGHAGTLDPMAQGVLVVILGQATKLAPYIGSGLKTYCGELELGLETDTYDIEGKVIATYPWDFVTEENVREAVADWTRIENQDVPPVAAAKHQGQPLYALARSGREVPVKTKPVRISRTEILDMTLPRTRFRVECSPGTYIRSLAHSLGKRLGCGAALTGLVRERSHPFDLGQAHGLDAVLAEPERFSERVIPIRDALPDWPLVRLDRDSESRVRNGAALPVEASSLDTSPVEGQRALLASQDDSPLALAEIRIRDGRMVWSVLRGLWAA